MSGDPLPPLDEGTLDLLIKQVTEGLQPAEQRALDALDSGQTSAYARELERAAVAALLAGIEPLTPLPDALRSRIEAAAPVLGAAARPAPAVVTVAPPGPLPVRPAAANAGWWAAAACLLIAAIGWLRPHPGPPLARVPQTPAPVTAPPAAPPTPAPPPTLDEQRAALLARPGVIDVPLKATKDPGATGLKGDVVWDPVLQQGVVRFEGLPPNDPQARQYQLWIFDAGRDARYPIDGGVFDVPPNRTQVLIPLTPRLPVRSAAAFAITIEKPGGVVVSKREHVLALGQTS